MPLKNPIKLPTFKVLSDDNIFLINEDRADTQDVRVLKIGILNLMPKKIVTENQLLRYLSNTPLQVDIKLIKTKSYVSHTTPLDHLEKFYSYFDEIKEEKFDGFIITGAPIEQMKFEDVAYWEELTEIMEWSKTNVFSTFHICWGAQAGLYYHHNVPKYDLKEKMFGVFLHCVNDEKADLTRGLSDIFNAPHSRYTEVKRKDIEKILDLEILSESEEAGIFIVATKDRRKIYITGHLEYDKNTLRDEYIRDKEKGEAIAVPKNYFKNNDPNESFIHSWRGSANIVFSNWLNYCVYQNTPYDIDSLQ